MVKYCLCPHSLDDRMWSTVKRKLAVVRYAVDGSPDKARHSPSASSPVAVRTPNPSTSAVRGAQLSSTQRLISTFFVAGDTGSSPVVPKSPKDDEFAMSPGDERLFEEASAPGALERAMREAARRKGWAQADAELAGAYGGAAR